jgi:predicted phage gp36 major capsid-like protein
MNTVEMQNINLELAEANVPVPKVDDRKFRAVFREMRSRMQAELQRVQKERAEAEKAAAKKAQQRRINEIYGLIAQLRSRLMSGGRYDKNIASQISVLQSELLWLLIAL